MILNNLENLFCWKKNCLQIVVKKKKVHSDENYHPRTENPSSRLNFDISYTPTEVSQSSHSKIHVIYPIYSIVSRDIVFAVVKTIFYEQLRPVTD